MALAAAAPPTRGVLLLARGHRLGEAAPGYARDAWAWGNIAAPCRCAAADGT